MATRSSDSGRPARSSTANWVRTAIMPQPMSTPTAAGMIARRVGMTDPTVAPLPRCASGIRATCGKTNGMVAVVSACSRVLSPRIEAQLINLALIFSIFDTFRSAGGPHDRGQHSRVTQIDRATHPD